MRPLLVCFFLLPAFILDVQSYSVVNVRRDSIENDSPVIGVLSQEYKKGGCGSYIAASYVKFVESGGARVIPIWIGKDRSYYEDIMKKVNGILFPGGNAWFMDPNGYSDAGEHIYAIAKEMNDQNIYFPLWGTCLGFELLTYLSADRKEHRADCFSQSQPLNLDFKNDYKSSKLFENAPNEITSILKTEDVTSNFHKFCVTEANMTKFHLDDEWRTISTNRDFNGLEFVSAIESKNYPFYGVQFHPEKSMYEWAPGKNITHSRNAVRANSYFAYFFVDEARKNNNHFTDEKQLDDIIIYNFPPTFTGSTGSAFEQSYLFECE